MPPHQQQAYAHMAIPTGAYPIAEDLAATSLSLPMWLGMQEPYVVAIAAAVRSFYDIL